MLRKLAELSIKFGAWLLYIDNKSFGNNIGDD